MIFYGEFITIPESLILDTDDDIGKKAIMVLLFFWMYCGRNQKIMFSIESLVSNCKFIPNYREGSTNDSFMAAIKMLCDKGYVSCDLTDIEYSKSGHSKFLLADFHHDYIHDRIQKERFAKTYLDEIEKLISYGHHKNSKSITNFNLIYLFVYLRLKITFRNKTTDGEEEKVNSPEAFYRYYKDLAEETGINERILSVLLRILSDELGLIVLKHTRRKVNNQWVTLPTIFCNAYKRTGDKECSGEDYYSDEIKNMASKMSKFNFKKSKAKVEESEIKSEQDWLNLD